MIVAAIAAAVVALASGQDTVVELGGRWEGALSVQGQSIRLVVRVQDADGRISAVLDSPDQGATGLGIEGLSLDGGVVRFAVPQVGGRFEGLLSSDGASIAGALKQGPVDMPLVLNRTAESATVDGPRRPQTPVAPFPYRSEDVVIDTPTLGVRLAGTLTVPEGAGPFPAVLLITGSGQQDRDETVFGHKPFHVLADALSRRGVAVLRVDDRGAGRSTGPVEDATSADFATDAGAAYAWLVARPETADARVGLLGHSEGGTIAPLVAQADPRVAFVVMLAGPAVSGGDILVEQVRRLAAASGLTAEQANQEAAVQARYMAAVATNRDDGAAAAAALQTLLVESGRTPEQARRAAAAMSSPWYRWFVAHDPAASIAALPVPLLAIYGGKDVQVPADQNGSAVSRLKPDARVVVLPDLNHLMQTAGTGLPAEYAMIEETIDPEALRIIVDWIAAR